MELINILFLTILLMLKCISPKLLFLRKLMSTCANSETEKRERLGDEVFNNLIVIMQLQGKKIKHMVVDENGVFHEQKDYFPD